MRLHPTESVSPGQSTLVTFGVPFPRGSVTAASLATVRVLKNGTEIPAYVDALTPWRHAMNSVLNGTSIRVVRIQIHNSFAAAAPASELITVQWGGANRAQNVATLVPPRNAWHLVTEGVTSTGGLSYSASDNVFEPDVYAVLPKAWLVKCGIKSPMAPMDDSVAEARVAPASIAASYPNFVEADRAQVNFFYTIINADDPLVGAQTDNNTNFFLTDAEPWLYDRSMVMYVGYFRSGFFRFLREAVRNNEYYRSKLYRPSDCNDGSCVGSFSLKNPSPIGWQDSKYSYNEPLATTYWLTGDPSGLPQIEEVVRVTEQEPTVPNLVDFTERKSGIKLMANVVAWEVTGLTKYRDKMLSIITDFRNAQVTPYHLPSESVPADGGIWHSVGAHEGGDTHEAITSPWMSALISDAVLRSYMSTESPEAALLIRGLGNHVCGVGTYMTTIRDGENGLSDLSNGAPVRMVHYLATPDGLGVASEFNPYTDFEHAHEVATIAAWGGYFSAKANDTTAVNTIKACTDQLYTTFSHTITYWTRPSSVSLNYDGYRITPPRKYGWWFKNSSGFVWAKNQLGTGGGGPTPPSASLTSPSSGATFTAPASITLTATATASGSASISKVEFLSGATLVAEDTIAPYTFTMTNVGAGSYTFTARATDSATGVATSAPVSVTVTAGGDCGLSTLANGLSRSFPAQSGNFTVVVDATPLEVNGQLADTGVGIDSDPPVGETSPFHTAATVRFYAANHTIDARNAGVYPATTIPWAAGQTYRVRFVVDMASHTYAAYVTAPGGTEQTIGTGLAFRSNYATATSLNNVKAAVDGGSLQLCNFSLPGGSGDTTPPTLALTAPAAGATVSGTINLTANASDNVGVAGVQFLVDNNAAGAEDTASPYAVSFNTTTLANGSHTVSAKARDAAGNIKTATAISVTVNNADTTLPTVALTAPAAGSTLSGTISLTANASDNVAVAGVQFLVDGNAAGAEDTASPYAVSFNTTTLANGNHTFAARARDAAGNTTTSAAVTAAVNNADATAPTVTLTAPAAGSTLSATINLTANASDNVAVVGVQFLVDGAAAGAEDTASPYSVSVNTTTLSNGSHSFAARARDAAGNVTTSPAVNATVSNNGDVTAPSVSLTAPTAGSTLVGTITLKATASDSVGVVGVRFYVDGVAVGTEDLVAPYAISFDTKTLSTGSHLVSARARDAAGNVGTSNGATISVQRVATFRNGVGGYIGTQDLTITNQTGGNGVTQRAGYLYPIKVSAPTVYEKEAFVRFTALTLPAGAQIQSATLTLVFDSTSAAYSVRGRYLSAPWNYASGALGWLNRNLATPWTTPGAKGDGSDVVAGKSFVMGTFMVGVQTKTIVLDPAIVQQWIATPLSNQGIVLASEVSDELAALYSSEATYLSLRPMLEIRYVN